MGLWDWKPKKNDGEKSNNDTENQGGAKKQFSFERLGNQDGNTAKRETKSNNPFGQSFFGSLSKAKTPQNETSKTLFKPFQENTTTTKSVQETSTPESKHPFKSSKRSHQTQGSSLQDPKHDGAKKPKSTFGEIASFGHFTPKKSFPAFGDTNKLPKPPLHPPTPTKRAKSSKGIGVVGSKQSPLVKSNLSSSFEKTIVKSPEQRTKSVPRTLSASHSSSSKEIKNTVQTLSFSQLPYKPKASIDKGGSRKRQVPTKNPIASPKRRASCDNKQQESLIDDPDRCIVDLSSEELDDDIIDRQKQHLKSICEIIDFMRAAHREQEQQKVEAMDQDLLVTELLYDSTILLFSCMAIPELS